MGDLVFGRFSLFIRAAVEQGEKAVHTKQHDCITGAEYGDIAKTVISMEGSSPEIAEERKPQEALDAQA